MYKSNVEAMPREIKEELVNTLFLEKISVDDIISLESKKSSKYSWKEIRSCVTENLFPHYWIVTTKSEPNNDEEDFFSIVFEYTLSEHQEKIFFDIIKSSSFKDCILSHSTSDKYGIY